MGTIRRSYAIFCESLSILAKDKEILIFPLLSGIITIIAFASMVFAGVTSGLFEHLGGRNKPLAYAVLFVWYFVSWFIVDKLAHLLRDPATLEASRSGAAIDWRADEASFAARRAKYLLYR